MKIEFYQSDERRTFVVNGQDLEDLVKESGLNPSEQIDYVENNPEAHFVAYAILFDDNWNVEKMFVRNLRFPE